MKNLKLFPVVKPKDTNPVLLRRNKLIRHLNSQIEKVRKFKTGEKIKNPWFWFHDDGNIYLQIKYGKIVVELQKGKYSILCVSVDDIEENQNTVKNLVMTGGFDSLLEKVSQDLRSNFKKKYD